MQKWAIFGCFLLIGCAADSGERITLADGSAGTLVRCNGMTHSMADCMLAAGRACPAGYVVADQASTSTPMHIATEQGAVSGAMQRRSMIIRCKP